MEKLILTSNLAVGDMVVMSAAIRDLHASHPGRYLTDVRTRHPDLWLNNPHITPIPDGEGRVIPMHYLLIHQSNQLPLHFIHGYRLHLAAELGIEIKPGRFRGDIHLTEREKKERPVEYPYWVIASGGKRDLTAKWWDVERWQMVVDYWSARGVKFVQVGDKRDVHPPLRGVDNRVGVTSLRDLIVLIQHSEGVLCPVTSLMHLAAALPMSGGALRPCVVVAGGREPSHWEAYPGHRFLDTIGQLPCCASGGCWKSHVWPGAGGKNGGKLCERPVEVRKGTRIPACLDRITAAQVIDALGSYRLPAPPVVKHQEPCVGCGAAGPVNTDPRVWGPERWRAWHWESGELFSPEREKERIRKFIAGLPCEDCRRDFGEIVAKHPPVFDSREAYRDWRIERHNDVNEKLGRPRLTIEQAVAAIAAAVPRPHKLATERVAVCVKCEHYQPATHEPPRCTRTNELLKPKILSGACAKWDGNELPEKAALPEQTVETSVALRAQSVGLVIGTFAAVPYIHLQLESRRRFHPEMPCVVIDDCSPRRAELAALCERYGVEFISLDERSGHYAGDMKIFLAGIQWAKAKGLKTVVKFSRRWCPVGPWLHTMDEGLAVGAPTLSSECSFHHFGFRSECVAMSVEAWSDPDVLRVLVDQVPAAMAADPVMNEGRRNAKVLVEAIIHHAARVAWQKYATPQCAALENTSTGAGWYARWSWMGGSRIRRVPGVLWHEWAKPEEYLATLLAFGIAEYQIEDFPHGRAVPS